MKRLFVVIIESTATAAQRDAFTIELQQAPVSFWHHLTSTWLIADSVGLYDVRKLRDRVKELMPKVALTVIEIKPVDYSTFSNKAGHKWLKEHLDGSDN